MADGSGKRLTEAIEWCREHGLEFDLVNENCPDRIKEFGGDCRKLSADLYIDDRSMVDVWSLLGIENVVTALHDVWSRRGLTAVDFDGTLCANAYPSIGRCNKRLISVLKRHRKRGGRLALWTCRMDAEEPAPEPRQEFTVSVKPSSPPPSDRARAIYDMMVNSDKRWGTWAWPTPGGKAMTDATFHEINGALCDTLTKLILKNPEVDSDLDKVKYLVSRAIGFCEKILYEESIKDRINDVELKLQEALSILEPSDDLIQFQQMENFISCALTVCEQLRMEGI